MKMTHHDWKEFLEHCWDRDIGILSGLPGHSLTEWFALHEHDWDEVDSIYTDHETQGG